MTNNPFGNNPFETVLKDLMKVIGGQNNLASTVAGQFAISLSSQDGGDANIDPVQRIRAESIFEIAKRELASNSLISDIAFTNDVSVVCVSRLEYVQQVLVSYQQLISQAEELSKTSTPASFEDESMQEIEIPGLPFGQMATLMGPMMTGVNVGSMLGHLSQEILASYEVTWPIDGNQIFILTQNLDTFVSDWNLKIDEATMWTSLNQIAMGAIMKQPAIKEKLYAINQAHTGASMKLLETMSKQIGEMDLSDPSSIEALASNPAAIMNIELSQEQERLIRQSRSVIAVVVGLADYVASNAARHLLGTFDSLAEATRRKRIDRPQGVDLFEKIFGIGADAGTYELGHKFIFGVLERNGEEALARIVNDSIAFPTANEVEAPGLWLARLETL
ncbi:MULTISPECIES: zinc-dependent metalloprotease [Acidithrix]|uniref:Hydrolase n=1 Tax=Acidithrix ferrooxidans TaxID=1280514 RepID=A0A0D8HG15_9ACTN|nr:MULTISPECIES: zinc-dependent metalloprotease [Acidithrix]KJF16006.1 hypothetical protein AXFE_31590 [Acidithrix ferrooxidans]